MKNYLYLHLDAYFGMYKLQKKLHILCSMYLKLILIINNQCDENLNVNNEESDIFGKNEFERKHH